MPDHHPACLHRIRCVYVPFDNPHLKRLPRDTDCCGHFSSRVGSVGHRAVCTVIIDRLSSEYYNGLAKIEGPGLGPGLGVIGLSDQAKDSTRRGARADSAAFDQPLFERKLQELIEQTEWDFKMGRHAVFNENGGPLLVQGTAEAHLKKLVDSDIRVLRVSFVPGVDKACRDVQRSSGSDITSEFIREELVPRVFAAINEREAETHWSLEMIWAKNDNRFLSSALAHLLREMDEFKNALNNHYAMEIGQFEKQESQPRPSYAKKPNAKSLTGSLTERSAQGAKSDQRKATRGESLFTRAVKKALIRAPYATGLEICRSTDDDWGNTDGYYEERYLGDAKARKQLDSRFSKIRNRMRKEGL